MADNHHRLAVKAGQSADNGVVVAIIAVTVQFGKFSKDKTQVIVRKGTIDVARHLGGLPARQVGKNIFAHLFRFLFKFSDLRLQINGIARHFLQLLNLPLQVGNRFFKFEIILIRHFIDVSFDVN